MEQLILHLVGDYLTQSHWMANGKTKYSWIAAVHAATYAFPFLTIGSWRSVVAIGLSHFLMDRFRLARFAVFAKNHLGPNHPPMTWEDCKTTGYSSEVPPWLSVWLMIAADNTIHLGCNYVALYFL